MLTLKSADGERRGSTVADLFLSECATMVTSCGTAQSQGAGELRSFPCQFCSAQLFALPGNFGSALFILKLVIKGVQGVCMELGWPFSV